MEPRMYLMYCLLRLNVSVIINSFSCLVITIGSLLSYYCVLFFMAFSPRLPLFSHVIAITHSYPSMTTNNRFWEMYFTPVMKNGVLINKTIVELYMFLLLFFHHDYDVCINSYQSITLWLPWHNYPFMANIFRFLDILCHSNNEKQCFGWHVNHLWNIIIFTPEWFFVSSHDQFLS